MGEFDLAIGVPNEVWYCQHHRAGAFLSRGALADELRSLLELVDKVPGMTEFETQAKYEHIQFLKEVGLLRIDEHRTRTNSIRYSLFLTQQGEAFLQKSQLPPVVSRAWNIAQHQGSQA